MKVTQRVITPRTATKILSSNSENNRKIRDNHVAKLARDMTNGAWVDNGETIIISNTGELLDGQHRLSAIIKSGIKQKMVVVTGVPNEFITTIDQGASRGLHDALQVYGFKNSSALAATYRLVSSYKRRNYVCRSRHPKARSATEAIKFIEDNPVISDAVFIYRGKRSGGRSVIPDTVWSAMYALLKVNYRSKLEEFHHRVELGLEITKGCPSYFLRDMYIENRSSKARVGSGVIMYDLVLYWNEFLSGNRLRKPITDYPDRIKLVGAV